MTTGRVDAEGRSARHFAAAPNVMLNRSDTIRNALRAQGWLPGREVIVLSDGDPSLVGAVRAAVRGPVRHILDWFHISMRVRHIEQALAGLLGSDLEHKSPLDYAAFNVDRLRHLIWNGYADEARRTLPGIMQMAVNAVGLNGQQGRARIERFAQLVRELESYLGLNASALIDYGRRYRADLPISTSRAESIVNSLVNARMNKRRQMRWSPRGAHRVLQVRAAGVVTLISIGRIETNSAAWQLQAATLAADFHSAMALRRWRWVAEAERRERGGTKRLRTAEKTFTNRCRYLGNRNPCSTRSRRRNGRCEFSARLLSPLCARCSTSGMT